MKKPLKMSAVAGIVLSVLSALICISLLLAVFDFGGMNPANSTVLYRFGKMFTSVYGLCSVLIPLFLIYAVIQCFAESWTVRRGVVMLGAFIPFFTLDALEHVCRMMIEGSEGPVLAVKLSAALLTGALVILIEMLLLSLLGDVIERLAGGGETAEDKVSESDDDAIENVGEEGDASDEADYALGDKKGPGEAAVSGVTGGAAAMNRFYGAEITGGTEDDARDAEEADVGADLEGAEEAGVLADAEEENVGAEEKDISHLNDGSENPFLKLFEKKETAEETAAEEETLVEESAPADEAEDGEDSVSLDEESVEEGSVEAEIHQESRPVPHYNENVSRYEPEYLNRPRYGENESSEILEMESFNPEIDSFDGNFNESEEAAELEEEKEFEDDDSEFLEEADTGDETEPISVTDSDSDDTILDGSFESESIETEGAGNEGASEEDSFDDDFFDIDMNAEDEEELAEKQEESEKSEGAIGSLDSIFHDMDKDAFREPMLGEEAEEAEDDADDFSMFEPQEEDLSDESSELEEDFVDEIDDEDMDLEMDADFDEAGDADTDAGLDLDIGADADADGDEYTEADADGARDSNTIDEVDESVFGLGEDGEEGDGGAVLSNQGAADVDPLAPPVVDADGVPYSTSVPIDIDDMSFDSYGNGNVAAFNDGLHASPSPAEKVAAAQKTRIIGAGGEAVRMGDTEPKPKQPKRKISQYKIPTEGILESYTNSEYWVIDEETKQAGEDLRDTLNEFKIEAEVTGIRKGPVVTMFEILPAPGVKLSKIVALQDNIALRLAASSVRIVAPIPGKHAVGIEVPNKERAIVGFKEMIDRDLPQYKKMAVPVVLGKDISGEPQIIDLAKTPHLLIAGSTGAGKSVCVNSMILSILFKRSPEDVKMILIDPKIVELKLYNDIPHLLTPVITEPKRAFQSLQYCLSEMERRYALLDGMGVRDIISYNNRIKERHIATEKLPYIIVVIDEFADLMATTGKELESTLARLAAMSRAVGIHLVLATQRPSIDVITGLIKANIPSRIAFMVASKMDSRIIIDQVGAEKLLGKGDMLYASATDPFPVRIQGTLVSDDEVERTVDYVKSFGEPEYIDDEIFVDDDEEGGNPGLFGEGDDPLYDEALQIVMQAGKASASYIQRRLKIGYNRAARLVEEMEERGIVGPANGSKPREVIHVPV